MLEAPDFANAFAISGPTPEPRPVMAIVLPFVESAGKLGSMAGYASLWKVFVGDGQAMVVQSNSEAVMKCVLCKFYISPAVQGAWNLREACSD